MALRQYAAVCLAESHRVALLLPAGYVAETRPWHSRGVNKSERTVAALARSVGKHFDTVGLPPSALIDLACRLVDEASRRIARSGEADADEPDADPAVRDVA